MFPMSAKNSHTKRNNISGLRDIDIEKINERIGSKLDTDCWHEKAVRTGAQIALNWLICIRNACEKCDSVEV